MGKTNLISLLTYFTVEEALARKALAKEAGLSISNFNRQQLGYSILKQGKPKKKIEEIHLTENRQTTPIILKDLKLEDEFLEILPNENDLNVIFSELNPLEHISENEEIDLEIKIVKEDFDKIQPSLF